MLSDHEISALGLVTPLQAQLIQPCSVDLTLGARFAVLHRETQPRLIVGTDTPNYVYNTMADGEEFELRSGQFALFETAETLHLPNNIAGKFEGKSSLGRIGLMTHVTAGFIDPGFNGILTLELFNLGNQHLVLRPGIRIGQVSFTRLDSLPDRTYGDASLNSHYQNAQEVQGALFGYNWKCPECGLQINRDTQAELGKPIEEHMETECT